MKKILFSLVAVAMLITFAGCGSEPSTASKFLGCCESKNYKGAKEYIDELTKDFDSYSSEDKSAILAGMASLVSYSKDPELGDEFITLYNKVKDDSTVDKDKDIANFVEWIESGFTTSCEYIDADEEKEILADDTLGVAAGTVVGDINPTPAQSNQ